MDTSEQYIKMCDCEEIILQAPQLRQDGQDFWVSSPNMGIPSLHPIWLPRQDQLQEMVAGDMVALHLLDKFYELVAEYHRLPITRIDDFVDATMEQLWLAFAMAEKYNKAWDGEKWIEQK